MADNENKPASDAEFNRVYWEQVRTHPHLVADETDPDYDSATHRGPTKQRIARAVGPVIGPNIEAALTPMRTKVALHLYRRTAEPLFALAVVEGWPIGFALPDEVVHYLRAACEKFGAAAREEVKRQKPEGLNVGTVLAHAFGLVGGARKPNAVERTRTAWNATGMAQEYEAKLGPGAKSEVIVGEMAERRGSTRSTIWRNIKLGRTLPADLAWPSSRSRRSANRSR